MRGGGGVPAAAHAPASTCPPGRLRNAPRRLVLLALRLLVDGQRLEPALRGLGAAEDLVEHLAHVVDKDKLDAGLDALGHVLVNVGLACRGDDQFWGLVG